MPKSKASEDSHASRQRPHADSPKTSCQSRQGPTLVRANNHRGLIRVRESDTNLKHGAYQDTGLAAFAAGHAHRSNADFWRADTFGIQDQLEGLDPPPLPIFLADPGMLLKIKDRK